MAGTVVLQTMSAGYPPVISLEDLRARTPSALHSLKDALLCPTFGYFELDCSQSSFDVHRTYEAALEFFAQPTEVKCQYVHTQYVSESGGYVPILEEYAYVKGTAALVESFDVVRDLSLADLRRVRDTLGADAARGLGPMDWPVEVSDMKPAFRAFYSSCDDAAKVLMTSVALALGLDERTFSQYFGDTAHCSMRAMHYPTIAEHQEVQKSEVNESHKSQDGRRSRRLGHRISSTRDAVSIVGIAEHTDFEFITILHQTVQGLELKGRDGSWRLAAAHPDSPLFTVIFADALEIFTNGLVRATPHRVLASQNDKDRYSLVRFNGLNDLAIVEPLTQFVTVERPRKFVAATQGEHVGKQVTSASDNLAQMLEEKKYPKTTLTAPPKRFAQMLIVAGDRILLGKHTCGEFAERFTGFIVEIEQDSELAPIDFARNGAVRRAGLNPVAFDALDQDLDIREVGRFRFTGWIPDTLVVEHEFVAVFDDAALALLFTKSKSKSGTKTTADMIPTWFRLDEIPYAHMPEDDEKWYSCCLNVAGVSSTGRDVSRVIDQLVIGNFHFENDTLAAWSTVAVPFKAPERSEMYRLV